MSGRGRNLVILVGNLGADPEVRNTNSGTAVCNLNLATSEKWKDKQTGQDQEKTEWHRIVMFGKLAEIAGQFLNKGRQVYIEGKLQTRKWQGQDGQDRYTTEIVANEMQMLGGGDGASQNAGRQQGGYQQQPQQNGGGYAQPNGGGNPNQGSYNNPNGGGHQAPNQGGYAQPNGGGNPNQGGYNNPNGGYANPNAPFNNDGQFDDDVPF